MHRDWLVSPSGLPCNAPPWGALVAFDLKYGQAALGSARGQYGLAGGIDHPRWMATAGGLVFTAAALDPHLHAVDASTGQEVWTVELPAGAQSTPMT